MSEAKQPRAFVRNKIDEMLRYFASMSRGTSIQRQSIIREYLPFDGGTPELKDRVQKFASQHELKVTECDEGWKFTRGYDEQQGIVTSAEGAGEETE